MDEIITELSKPVWWVSVVMAGIAINLLSAYLKNPIDGVIARTSNWWRLKSIARQCAWEDRIKQLRASEEARNVEWMLEIRLRLQSIHLLLAAIFILIIPLFLATANRPIPRVATIVCFAFSASVFFVSFLAFKRAVMTRHALYEARSEGNPLVDAGAAQ